MNDELLIELVRQHPVLYDLSNPKYMDNTFKVNTWNLIGNELETDGSLCKGRWNNIRDNYRKSLKRMATRSIHSTKSIKVYKYSDHLNFMNKFIGEREPKKNIELSEELKNETNVGDQDDVQEINQDFQSQFFTNKILAFTRNALNNDTLSTQTPRKFSDNRNLIQPTLNKYMFKQNANQDSIPTLSTHPVDAFLYGIAPTLKSLNPYFLNLAKSEIFATVQKYDLKMLLQNQPYDIDHQTNSQQQSPNSSMPSSPNHTSLQSLPEPQQGTDPIHFNKIENLKYD